MDVQLPDGTLIRGVPDGMSKADLTVKLKANGYDTSKLDAPTTPGYLDKVGANIKSTAGAVGDMAAGAVRGAGSIGATLLAPVDAAARGLGIQNDLIGRTDRRSAMDAGLQDMGADTNSLAFKTGKLGAEIAGSAGAGGAIAKAVPFAPQLANALATNGFRTGALPTTLLGKAGDMATRALGGGVAGGAQVGLVDPEHAGVAAGIGAALPPGIKALGAMAGPVGNALGRGAPLTAGRSAAVGAARDAGYVLPPTEINPSVLSSVVEGLSGKIKTAQAASFKNQPVTNTLAAKALGVDPATTLTPDVLQGIRKEAGQAYAAVKGTGTVTADAPYMKALDDIAEKYQGAAESFPGLAPDTIPKLVESLKQPSFDAKHAIDAIGILRDTADKAFRAGDTGVAKASKDAAQAMEDMIGRHLEATGQDPALVKSFTDAREKIAKTYSVQKALNVGDSNVSAPKLAAQLAKGAPLSGDLKTIAEAGAAFPKATEALTRNPNALSPLDYVAAVMNAKNSIGAGLAGLAVRPLVRGAILSQPFQKFAATPGPVNALAGPAVYRAVPRSAQN